MELGLQLFLYQTGDLEISYLPNEITLVSSGTRTSGIIGQSYAGPSAEMPSKAMVHQIHRQLTELGKGTGDEHKIYIDSFWTSANKRHLGRTRSVGSCSAGGCYSSAVTKSLLIPYFQRYSCTSLFIVAGRDVGRSFSCLCTQMGYELHLGLSELCISSCCTDCLSSDMEVKQSITQKETIESSDTGKIRQVFLISASACSFACVLSREISWNMP